MWRFWSRWARLGVKGMGIERDVLVVVGFTGEVGGTPCSGHGVEMQGGGGEEPSGSWE